MFQSNIDPSVIKSIHRLVYFKDTWPNGRYTDPNGALKLTG